MSMASRWFDPGDTAMSVWDARPGSSAFGRLWRVFMTARVAIATVLVLLQAFVFAMGSVSNQWSIAICVAYLCTTLALRIWGEARPPGTAFDAQWLSTIGVDVLTFFALNFIQSNGINYTPLFALPVLLASVLGPIQLAFGTAAGVTLLLLADAWAMSWDGRGDFSARLLQSGLSGSGFFLVALLANQLAQRLAREEQSAKTSEAAARMQTRVNELVIESLADGILVVDAAGTVRSANPASLRMLTSRDAFVLRLPFALTLETAWAPLATLISRTFMTQTPQEADVSLAYPATYARQLRARTRLASSYDNANESLCVMFLEDLREMEARLRTEKVAAMGRMSAAVAHEIRNPLAAISQANALLEEDLKDPQQRQLTRMVAQNAQRLAKIVDEILNISRAQAEILMPDESMLVLDDAVLNVADEWATQVGAARQLRVSADTGTTLVWFEPEHLRRLMVNLLDNALRYASDGPASIRVSTQIQEPGDDQDQARLAVWSDGLPLEKTVQQHLFEPFFSSESRSSGLGLYICRELCERYGAVIGYQRLQLGEITGNEFFVVFRPATQTIRPASCFDILLA